jgi:hypothetical protein
MVGSRLDVDHTPIATAPDCVVDLLLEVKQIGF